MTPPRSGGLGGPGKRPQSPPASFTLSNTVITLKHGSCGIALIELRAHITNWIVVDKDRKRHRIAGTIPFRDQDKRRTLHFKYQIGYMMTGYGSTVRRCAVTCRTTPAIVKEINEERLFALAGDMRPTHPSRAIAVDEFLIAHGHRYCTVVIDADTGGLLYLERGKKKEQNYHFFTRVADDSMRGVRAVSMDMNANYATAFQDRWPHIKVAYDGFRIIQWFSKQVVGSFRKSEANKLKKQADALQKAGDIKAAEEIEAGRKLLFGARFSLLANERTLKAKDALNAELNAQAKIEALTCERNPAEVGCRRENNAEARRALLDTNTSLQCALKAREELQEILKTEHAASMRMALKKWCDLYSRAGITQLTQFVATIFREMGGIVSRADHRISSDVLEGANTLIKNMRRRAFGLVGFDYFGLLLWEITHMANRRRRKGSVRPCHRVKKRNARLLRQTIYRWDQKELAVA